MVWENKRDDIICGRKGKEKKVCKCIHLLFTSKMSMGKRQIFMRRSPSDFNFKAKSARQTVMTTAHYG